MQSMMNRVYLYQNGNCMMGFPYYYVPGPYYYQPTLFQSNQAQVLENQASPKGTTTPKNKENYSTQSMSSPQQELYEPKSALFDVNNLMVLDLFSVKQFLFQAQDDDVDFERKRRFKHSSRNKKKSDVSKYKKKNTESNISNQIFSFVCNKNKSKVYLNLILKHHKISSPKILSLFYSYAAVVKKSKTKYMNKKIIAALCRVDLGGLFHDELLESGVLSPALSCEMFSKLVRILINKYLTKLSPLVLMTSKKMDKNTCLQHLERRRQILAFLKESF